MELNWKDWIVGLLSVTRGWPCAVAFSTTLPGGDERKSKRQPRFTVHRMHIVWCLCVVYDVCVEMWGVCVWHVGCMCLCVVCGTRVYGIYVSWGEYVVYMCVWICVLYGVCVWCVMHVGCVCGVCVVCDMCDACVVQGDVCGCVNVVYGACVWYDACVVCVGCVWCVCVHVCWEWEGRKPDLALSMKEASILNYSYTGCFLLVGPLF